MKFIYIFLVSIGTWVNAKTQDLQEHVNGDDAQRAIVQIYDSLIGSVVDSLILYHEIRTDNETEGLFSWKKGDILLARKFKTKDGNVYLIQNIDSPLLLKEGRGLYFSHEQFFPDSTKGSLKASHEFWICIKSSTKTSQRIHFLNSTEVVFRKKPFELIKISRMFHDVLYSN